MGRWPGASVLVAIASAAGCAAAPGPRPAEPASAIAPPPAYRPWRPAVDLPVSATAEPVPASAYPVFIAGRTAYVGLPALVAVNLVGDASHSDFPHPAGYGPGFIEPLARAVEARPCGPGGVVPPIAVVDVDAKLPYRLLIESLYTLSVIGYHRLYVATRPDASSPTPQPMGIRISVPHSWQLMVIARRDGFSLRAADLVSAARCPGESEPTAGAPDLPATQWGLDFTALHRCVDAIAPAGSALYLSPDADLSVQTAVKLAGTLATGRYVTLAFPTPRKSKAIPTGGNTAGTVSNASRVVGGMRADFRACYNAELARNPAAGGQIHLTIYVGSDGNVTNVEVVPSGNLGTTVECVRARAAAAHFAPPEGGKAVVSVPVTFVSQTPVRQGPVCTPPR